MSSPACDRLNICAGEFADASMLRGVSRAKLSKLNMQKWACKLSDVADQASKNVDSETEQVYQ